MQATGSGQVYKETEASSAIGQPMSSKELSFSLLRSSLHLVRAPSVSPATRSAMTSSAADRSACIMNRRLLRKCNLPHVDQISLNRGSTCAQQAPLYSQAAYESMLRREYAVGSSPADQMFIVQGGRRCLVHLIEHIHALKSYRELTLYLAVSIADRYLAEIAAKGVQAPKVVLLAAVSLLLAAKINESKLPNFNNMTILASEHLQTKIEIVELTRLERQILIELEFDLQSEVTLNFVERFLQLFYLDAGLASPSPRCQATSASFESEVCAQAKLITRLAQRKRIHLHFKPSRLAAAIVLLAIYSTSENEARLEQVSQFETLSWVDSEIFEASPLTDHVNSVFSWGQDAGGQSVRCAVSMWSEAIEAATGLSSTSQVEPAYEALLQTISIPAQVVMGGSAMHKLIAVNPSCGMPEHPCQDAAQLKK